METSVQIIEMVALGFEELLEKVVFVGGSVTGIYATDKAAAEARPTDDVDCVVEVAKLSEFYNFENQLRSKGFTNDTESKIICRWKYHGISVDIMPTNEKILGFSNRWYSWGVANAKLFKLPNGKSIKILSAPCFIATKIEAFKSRGEDMRYDSDFEDIIYILNNRSEIENEIAASPTELRLYLKNEFNIFLSKQIINEAVSTSLMPEEDRVTYVIEIMKTIVKSE